MAILAAIDETLVQVDRYSNMEYVDYVFDLGTDGDEWSQVTMNLAPRFLEAYIVNIFARSINAPATARDLDAQRERFTVFLLKGNQIAAPSFAAFLGVSEQLANSHVSLVTAVPNGWIAQMKFQPKLHVSRSDAIRMVVPPTDDGATATADLEVMMQIEGIKYTKK